MKISFQKEKLGLLGQSGFTLVEALISTVILGVGVLSLAAVSIFISDGQVQYDSSTSKTLFKARALSLINNPISWQKTLEHPSNLPFLSCKLTNGACGGISDKLVIVGVDGSLFYDGTAQGFDDRGEVCVGYDAANGNDQCPNRYNITWDLTCNGACNFATSQPQITVRANLEQSRKTQRSIRRTNANEMTFVLNRNLPKFNDFVAYPDSTLANKGDQNISLTARVSTGYTVNAVTITPSANGNATANGTHVSYTPISSYDGSDFVTYTATSSRLGMPITAKSYFAIGVMTPYTWVGDAKDGLITSTRNWCGTVVNGVCTYNQSTASFTNSKMIFNDLCNDCTINLNSPITVAAFKLDNKFMGIVNQSAPMTVVARDTHFGAPLANCGDFDAHDDQDYFPERDASDPRLTSLLQVSGGTFNSSAIVDVSYNGGSHLCNYSVRMDGGNFVSTNQLKYETLYAVMDANTVALKDWEMSSQYKSPMLTEIKNGPMTVENFAWHGGINSSFRGGIKGGLIVRGTLTYDPVNDDATLFTFNLPNSQIHARGDIVIRSKGGLRLSGASEGDAASDFKEFGAIIVDGTVDQKITGLVNPDLNNRTNPIGCLPQIIVDKPSGKLTMENTVCVARRLDWRNGIIDAANANLIMGAIAKFEYLSADSMGELVVKNLELRSSEAFRLAGQVRTTGNLYYDRTFSESDPGTRGIFQDPALVAAGDKYKYRFAVEGDVFIKSGHIEDGGAVANTTAWVELVGNKNQTISSLNGVMNTLEMSGFPLLTSGFLPSLAINKSGGNVVFQGLVALGGQLWVRNSPGLIDWSNGILMFNQYTSFNPSQMTVTGAPNMTALKGLVTARSMNFQGVNLNVTDYVLLSEGTSSGSNIANRPTTVSNLNVNLTNGGEFHIGESTLSQQRSFKNMDTVTINFTGNQDQKIKIPLSARDRSFNLVVNKTAGAIRQLSNITSVKNIDILNGTWRQDNFNLNAAAINIGIGTTLERSANVTTATVVSGNVTVVP